MDNEQNVRYLLVSQLLGLNLDPDIVLAVAPMLEQYILTGGLLLNDDG